MTERRTIYLIQRQVHDSFFGHAEDDRSRLPVAVYSRRHDAECRRDELERAARAQLSPFLFGSPSQLTRLAPEKLCLQVEALGLPALPAPPEDDWEWQEQLVLWWDEHAGEMSPLHREVFWELLDRWSFYEIVPVELEEEGTTGGSEE